MKNKKVKMSTTSVLDAVISNGNKKSSGKSKAGKSGNMFESVVFALQKLGFEIYKSSEIHKIPPNKLPKRYILSDVPYNSLLKQKADEYGLSRRRGNPRTEFVIVANNAKNTKQFSSKNGFLKIRIECKWQAVAGTAQSKLLFSVADLQYGSPEDNIILLMDGDGFDEAMHILINEVCEDGLTWRRAPKAKPKTIVKMRIQEFIDWCNEAFV